MQKFTKKLNTMGRMH